MRSTSNVSGGDACQSSGGADPITPRIPQGRDSTSGYCLLNYILLAKFPIEEVHKRREVGGGVKKW